MTPEQKAAYIMAQAAEAIIRAAGMGAENHKRLMMDESPAYDEEAYLKLIEEHGLDHNRLMTFLRD